MVLMLTDDRSVYSKTATYRDPLRLKRVDDPTNLSVERGVEHGVVLEQQTVPGVAHGC